MAQLTLPSTVRTQISLWAEYAAEPLPLTGGLEFLLIEMRFLVSGAAEWWLMGARCSGRAAG